MTCLVVCTIYKYCSTILSDLDKLWPLKVTDDGINVGHLRNFHLVYNIANIPGHSKTIKRFHVKHLFHRK